MGGRAFHASPVLGARGYIREQQEGPAKDFSLAQFLRTTEAWGGVGETVAKHLASCAFCSPNTEESESRAAALEVSNRILSSVSDYDYFSVSGDQEADQQQEFDKSSTIPRNSDISQSYRRMFQAKRPASTAGLPTTLGPAMVTPGVATIRRTPSTKPSVRRGTIGAGPIPIKTPVIPVKTPTVPDLPGVLPAPPDGPEERGEHSPESPSVGEGPQGVTSMPSSLWSGQASVNPPLPGPKPSIPEEHRQAIPESEADDQERDPSSATASPGRAPESEPADLSPRGAPQGEDMLNAIRRGVKLKKTMTNDRSAPRFS